MGIVVHGPVSGSLVSRTSVADVHVLVDHSPHARPMKVPSDKLECLFLSKMSYQGHIVVHSENLGLEFIGFEYVQLVHCRV